MLVMILTQVDMLLLEWLVRILTQVDMLLLLEWLTWTLVWLSVAYKLLSLDCLPACGLETCSYL